MVSKVYSVICGLFAIAAAALFVSGNLPVITAIVFGFVAFGLVFMGMMFVLPYTITHVSATPAKELKGPQPSSAPSFSRTSMSGGRTSTQHALSGPVG